MMNVRALRRHLKDYISENQVNHLEVVIVPWIAYTVEPFEWCDHNSGKSVTKEDISSAKLTGLTLAFRNNFNRILVLSGCYNGSGAEHAELEELLKSNLQWVTYDARSLYFGLFGEQIYLDLSEPIFDIKIVASLLLLGRTKADPHLPSNRKGWANSEAQEDMLSVSSLCQWLVKESGDAAPPPPDLHPQLIHLYDERKNAERTALQLVPLYEGLNRKISPQSRTYIEVIELPSIEANAWVEWVGVRICDHDLSYLGDWFSELESQPSKSKRVKEFLSSNKWLLQRPMPIGMDGRVHPVHTQNAAATGRSSFKQPKLQYIPKLLRALVQASPGNLILEVDYSSFDFSIAAAMFSDQNAIDCCMNGDPFSESIGGLDREQMKHAVQIWVHGGRELTLKTEMGISAALAQEIFRNLAFRYPQIDKGLRRIEATAREKGQIEISKGIVRTFNPNKSSDLWISSSAIATVLQGNGAMILKQAVSDIYKIYRGSSTFCFLTNHDSVLIETPREIAMATSKEVQTILEQAARKHIPNMPAKTKSMIGARWGKRSDMIAFDVV
jgi:DNA polymerase I-like protein with 3'-5' exonuclease and polymerase domains